MDKTLEVLALFAWIGVIGGLGSWCFGFEAGGFVALLSFLVGLCLGLLADAKHSAW